MTRRYDLGIMHCQREARTHFGRTIGWERTQEGPEYRPTGNGNVALTAPARYRYWTVKECPDCYEVWMEEQEFRVGSWLEEQG